MSKRVLITREIPGSLAVELRQRGFEPVHLPVLGLRATDDPPPCASALVGNRDKPNVALITSSAVLRFCPNLPTVLAGVEIVAVGEETANALRQAGMNVVSIGERGGREGVKLLNAWMASHQTGLGTWVWYVGAHTPSNPLVDALLRFEDQYRDTMNLGYWRVYRSSVNRGLQDKVSRLPSVEWTTFTSGRSASGLVEQLGLESRFLSQAKVAVIGHTTADVVTSLGLKIHAIAERPSMRDLAEAIFRASQSGTDRD